MPKSKSLEHLSDVIHDLRVSSGYTQAQLADLAGVSRCTVIAMETNPTDAKLSSVESVLNCLGLELVSRPIRPQRRSSIDDIGIDELARAERAALARLEGNFTYGL